LAKFPPPLEAVPVTGGPGPSSYSSTLLVALAGLAILGGLGLLRRSSRQRR
jgi:LPXTG-motif cell wall-anchored protein